MRASAPEGALNLRQATYEKSSSCEQILVQKVAYAGKDHGEPEAVRRGNHFQVAH